ncbi:adenine C2-methylase RlmN of 23S rRNA A2503 and tRNA A37 [Bacillus fengqiuensis]|nr:adenine C2-methylase RlmN of 23S rRNA A2503 and tRNA A37 [Bacillus fengqiuensis]
MDKIKLPMDVAKALEQIMEEYGKGWSKNYPVMGKAVKKNKPYTTIVNFVKAKGENYELLQEATFNGFEYDATPKERLREYYNALEDNEVHKNIVKDVLNILRTKVKGINDSE